MEFKLSSYCLNYKNGQSCALSPGGRTPVDHMNTVSSWLYDKHILDSSKNLWSLRYLMGEKCQMWRDLLTAYPSLSVCWGCCLEAVWTTGKFTSLILCFFFLSGFRLQLKARRVKKDSIYLPICHQVFSSGLHKQQHYLYDFLICILHSSSSQRVSQNYF